MSVFRSATHVNGVKFRPIKAGLSEVTATLVIPAGVALTTASTLRLLQFGANTQIHALTLNTEALDAGANALRLNVGFLSHNTGVTASNPTAYAAAATIALTPGVLRYEPLVATPAANYTLQLVPSVNATAGPVAAGRITVTAVIGPAHVATGLTDPGDGSGGAYDHGRANPLV